MLHYMDFITSEVIFFFLIFLSIVFLVLLILHIRLEIRIKKIMRGKTARDLEDLFTKLNADFSEYKEFKNQINSYLQEVDKRLATSVRGVETINFNAFSGAESGGKSFATAIVNEQGNGLIISSLQSRERLSIFTKKIENGVSTSELSEEEQESLTRALKSCSVIK